MRFISTRMHGVLDYTTAAGLIALPRALGIKSDAGRLLALAGLATLIYSMLTRYELGLVRILPMKVHLAVDVANGAAMCAAPLIVEVPDDQRKLFYGVGVFELVVALLSKSKSS